MSHVNISQSTDKSFSEAPAHDKTNDKAQGVFASVVSAVAPPDFWQAGRFVLPLSSVQVMGIVNITPDSFFDGGRASDAALRHCDVLLEHGAHILDLGAESSRPGADMVDTEEEWRRLQPVLAYAVKQGVAVSVDTYKTEVMRRALDMGADIINDIAALRAPGAVELVAAHPNCGVCLMHMAGEPRTMQHNPRFENVVTEVAAFLQERAGQLIQRGVAAQRVVLDPGIGFGKRVEDNFALIRGQQALLDLGFPVLAGWSRKSSLGVVTGREVSERLVASVAAALAAVVAGARIVRVHDVAETVDALKVWKAAGLMKM